MKILHIGKHYWPSFGGIETALRQLAEAGTQFGHDVECVVAGNDGPTVIEKVKIKRFRMFGRLFSTPISPSYLIHPVKDVDVLHVHLPNPLGEILALRCVSKKNVKTPVLIPYLHALPLRQGLLGRIWFKYITSKILNAANQVLISNARVLDSFPELEQWKNKMQVVPFAVDSWDESTNENHADERSRSLLVLAIGRLVPYKGFDVLIEAWGKMRERAKDLGHYRLEIIGQGPLESFLIKEIEKSGHGNSVRVYTHCTDDEKNQRLCQATLFVAPSVDRSETFGISILEAMGKGLPVITTRLPTGVALLARGGDCGAVVEPKSSDQLCDALIFLLRNNERRRQCGIENLQFARREFSFDALARNYEKIIQAACA